MKPSNISLRAAASLAAALAEIPALAADTAPAKGWGEPHLTSLPRSPEETARVAAVTAPPGDFEASEPFEARPAGAATHFDGKSRTLFSQPSGNMAPEREMDFRLGNGFFKKLWVEAPTVTTASDGLGPLFNGRGCKSCHIRDGRGHPPEGPEDFGISMVLRLSIPDDASDLPAEILNYLANAPEPVYGTQLQDKSIAGLAAEGRMRIDYEPVAIAFADGEEVELRKPIYSVTRPGYGPLHDAVELSPRIAPPMIGLGLLEAIPEADILALADPNDENGDGISGRPNRVWSLEHAQWMLGRFGWKAGQPTVSQQSSDAFVNDIGISTPIHPAPWGNCTETQTACRAAPHGETGNDERLEIPSVGMDLVSFYARNLALPAREAVDAPKVLRGKQLFHEAGCASCHQPKFVTHRLKDQPEQSFQLIWPYSDLLLHDMGDGLADNRLEWDATGREWRTPPLWGIGRTEDVSGHTYFLHDGRARSLTEAILWHGGEAGPARETFRSLIAADRAALIAFLQSL
ncbi:di-heme oxidoredictase family protein [Tropicimonas sp. TH_r6]|uniref:di-heme oxidoreductase family protein n=1 Tax=Tropicimonas sp. TH_r6 TaxID=3082085 RepID=UPI002955A743|nr:di-heme oxidoredictase family protein [Tropicimonas sp. TH_r6]MDV7141464.1 di-heme oxidoredictase family protein [Tropicimonas sp. TH_r6]